jgi:Yip1 domain.
MPGDPDYPVSQGAFPVWSKVYTKPNEQTFIEITEHPEAKAKSAYVWVFLAGALSGLINGVTRTIVGMVALKQTPELAQLPSAAGGAFGIMGLVGAICAAPVAGAFAVLGFMLSVGVVHATARFFGGQGTYDKLAYAFGAITVPVSIISAFLIPFNALPITLFCSLPLLVILGLYVLFLEVTAVKAVYRCGWGEAAAAFFMPSILLTLLCGLLFVGLMRVAGPSINEIMQQMQR